MAYVATTTQPDVGAPLEITKTEHQSAEEPEAKAAKEASDMRAGEEKAVAKAAKEAAEKYDNCYQCHKFGLCRSCREKRSAGAQATGHCPKYCSWCAG